MNSKSTNAIVANNRATKIAVIGMLSALAFITVVLIRIPVVLFLKYECKDIIIMLGGFLFGPYAVVAISLIVSFLEMITISTTGYIGFIMNVLSTCCFALPAAILFKKKRSLVYAIVGLVIGVLLSTGAMLAWNYLLTPIYMGYPRQAVAKMLLPTFLPFNLFKNGLNAAGCIIIHIPILFGLKKAHLLEQMQPSK